MFKLFSLLSLFFILTAAHESIDSKQTDTKLAKPHYGPPYGGGVQQQGGYPYNTNQNPQTGGAVTPGNSGYPYNQNGVAPPYHYPSSAGRPGHKNMASPATTTRKPIHVGSSNKGMYLLMLLFLPCTVAGFCLGRMFFQGKDGFVMFPKRQMTFPEPILFDSQDPYAQQPQDQQHYSSHHIPEGGYKTDLDKTPYSEPRQDRSRHPRGHHQPERYSETNIHDFQNPDTRFPSHATLAE